MESLHGFVVGHVIIRRLECRVWQDSQGADLGRYFLGSCVQDRAFAGRLFNQFLVARDQASKIFLLAQFGLVLRLSL